MEDDDLKKDMPFDNGKILSSEKEDNKKITETEFNKSDKQHTSQYELFESKLRSILFPEPIFSHYIDELKNKPSKPVKFPSGDLILKEDKLKDANLEDTKSSTKSTIKPQYTRYLRTWKKSIIQNDKLTNYLSNLRELHLAKLITFVEQMHKNLLFTDLDLYVEDLCFPVHKLILACYAPFIFQKLERSKTKVKIGENDDNLTNTTLIKIAESDKKMPDKLRLVNIDAKSFAIIINFMYTGIAQPNEQNFLPVLNASIHLFMFDFANAWVELYEHKFANRTAQMLFRSKIARQYNWSDYIQLLNSALAFDFEHLLISDQYEDLQFNQLYDILQMNDIGVVNEIVLYLAVLKWLNYNYEQRKQYALDLMRLIRFNNMNENELFACYNPPILPEVIELPEIKAMMADAFNQLIQSKKTFIDKNLKRNYRLADAYKDQPLKLWCYLINKEDNEKIDKQQSTTDHTASRSTNEDNKNIELSSNPSTNISTNMSTPQSTTNTSDLIIKEKLDNLKYIESIDSSSVDSSLSTSPITFSTLDKAYTHTESTTSDNKIDKLKSEIRADMKKLITDGQQSNTVTPKLAAVLKNIEYKPRLKDTFCRCKQVKHTSVEQCKRERAARIIQRSYHRFRKFRKTKLKSDEQQPKIRPKLIGKNIKSDNKTNLIDESLESLIKNDLSNNLKDENKIVNNTSNLVDDSSKELSILKIKDNQIDKLSKPVSSEISTTKTISSDQKTPKEYRTDQLLIYSDSVANQESFCGFYLCTGINKEDGQLLGWKKKIQFKLPDKIRQKKNLTLPYDTVVVSHGRSIYLVGGMQPKSNKKAMFISKQILKFNLNNRKLQSIVNLKAPRIQHSCCIIGDRLYVICGCKQLNQPLNTIECIHLMSNKNLINLKSYGRFGVSTIYFRNRLWIIGGIAKIENNFHLLSEIWILDTQLDQQNTNKWIKSKFPIPIAYAGICQVNEEFIYVIGGRCVGLNGKLQPSEKVWCFNVITKRWQQIVSLNQPRCNCCCILKDNRIYTFGGSLEDDIEHLRGQTGEYYELDNPNKGWIMLTKNLPCSISGQSVVNI